MTKADIIDEVSELTGLTKLRQKQYLKVLF